MNFKRKMENTTNKLVDDNDLEEGMDIAIDNNDERIKKMELEIKELKERANRYLSTVAELQNQISTLENSSQSASTAFAKKLIRTISHDLDSTDRLLREISNQNGNDQVHHALITSFNRLLLAFEKENIKVIHPMVGDKFDDNFHIAISTSQDTSLTNGVIKNVLSNYYMVEGVVVIKSNVIIIDNS